MENYINYLINDKNLQLKKFSKLTNENQYYWIICVHDLNKNNCNVETQVIKKHQLNRLDIILTK